MHRGALRGVKGQPLPPGAYRPGDSRRCPPLRKISYGQAHLQRVEATRAPNGIRFLLHLAKRQAAG